MQYKVGERLSLDYHYYVYELLDDNDLVFYVGMSKDPLYRFRSHANPKHCDNPLIAQTIAECRNPQVRIASIHPTRQEALKAEAQRVLATPGILNAHERYQFVLKPKKKKRSKEYNRRHQERRNQRFLEQRTASMASNP